ncbi:DUF7576 family protein [Natronorubrum halalkaliphilum]|uniref:DUF7576 family protein n=1 Tax=Natronorubrum halalkaliphilum TaxID=2691917 RepID=UPI001916479C|nr:hypothetical protein [Natronorubrum halalkaliphilum]
MVDSTDEDSPACGSCGELVASSSDQRVVTSLEEGEAAYEYFCSDDCLEVWETTNTA